MRWERERERAGPGGWRENLVSLTPSKNKPFMYLPPHAQSITSLFTSLPLSLSHSTYINTLLFLFRLHNNIRQPFYLQLFAYLKPIPLSLSFQKTFHPIPIPIPIPKPLSLSLSFCLSLPCSRTKHITNTFSCKYFLLVIGWKNILCTYYIYVKGSLAAIAASPY